ncbi:putative inner membrane protein translocase component YidC [Campylobacter geochelonis]|nr:putative inner membrane protein translocase component YidC [Campylobacter geochelonis]
MENLSMQKRVIIATLLAFVFFIGYDHFYLSKLRPQIDTNQTATVEQNQAPSTTSTSKDVTNVAPTVNTQKDILTIKGDTFHATIDDLGRINSFKLDEAIYKNEKGDAINLVDPTFSPMPLEMRFSDVSLNQKAFSTPYKASVSSIDLTTGEKSVVLTQDLGDLVVTKTIKFYPKGNYELDIKLSKEAKYFITPGMRPNIAVDGYTVHGALIRQSDESLDIIKDGGVEKGGQSFSNANIAAVFDRYYSTLFYSFDNSLNVVLSEDKNEINQLFVSSNGDFKTNGFIGPKNQKLLASINPQLTDIIEYGWFTFIAKPMFSFLSWLHGFTGNWGWAIVLLTIVIRVVLFPLTYKGMVSMNKMKDLAPKIKELQAKYKGEPQKMQAQMMDLYRKHGANPMGGCLPILLQIPVFFAIYRVLLNAIELQGAPWILWIHDLAIKDPYFILPIIMGASMFLQQRLTPTTFTDPMQEKIMKFLPLIFTFFFITFPAGLTLYWCVNNILSVIQQVIVNKIFKKQKEAVILEKKSS